jgi:hypothetical protein
VASAGGSHIGPARWWFHYNYASWRWIFFLNVPLELLGVFLAHWLIPDSRSSLFRIAFALVGTIAGAGAFSIDRLLLNGKRELNPAGSSNPTVPSPSQWAQ